MRRFKAHIILIFVFFYSCNKNIQFWEASRSENLPIKEEINLEYEYAFVEGTKNRILGNYEKANFFLEKAVEQNPKSSAAFYQLSILNYISGNISKSITFSEKAVELEKTNIWYYYQLASLYQISGDTKKMIDVYRAIVYYFPDKYTHYFDLANLLGEQKEYDDAISILNQLEAIIGINEQVILSKEKLYSESYDFANAILEIKKLNNEYPLETKYMGILAELFLSVGNEEEALYWYDELFHIDSTNSLALLSLASYYKNKKDYNTAIQFFEKAMYDNTLSEEVKHRELINVVSNKNYLVAKEASFDSIISYLVESTKNGHKFKQIKADFYLALNYKHKAIPVLKELCFSPFGTELSWTQLLVSENDLKMYDSVLVHGREAITLFETNSLVYLYTAYAYRGINDFAEALVLLDKGLGFAFKNQNIYVSYLTQLAENHNSLRNYIKSDFYFEKVLAIDEDNVLVLNNYSYYLALRGEKLDKALNYSQKLIKLRPESYFYLDTYAWVLHKSNKTKDALVYIDKSYQLGGKLDFEIVDHYGDILFKAGNANEAILKWEESISLGGDVDTLLKKINDAENILP